MEDFAPRDGRALGVAPDVREVPLIDERDDGVDNCFVGDFVGDYIRGVSARRTYTKMKEDDGATHFHRQS